MNTIAVVAPPAADALALAATVCFHCGLPVPAGSRWQVLVDTALRPMCCPGCEAVAQSIVDNGFADYYATRTGFANTAADSGLPPEVALADEIVAEAMNESLADAAGVTDTLYGIEGVRCAACVWLIERRIARLPGVAQAAMNVASQRLRVRRDAAACSSGAIIRALRQIGYAAYPYDPARHAEQLARAKKTLFRRVFVAGLSMMQVMMYAVPAYFAADGTIEPGLAALMRWASLVLTLPAVLYSAQPFFEGAYKDLKNRMAGMDVPVALGIVVAFVASVVATVRQEGEVYFDSVTMFVFLLLCSRYLELNARRAAAAGLDRLQHALPAAALRVPAYPDKSKSETVAAGRLREGDVILVQPGSAFATDGVIVEGETTIDVALLTGESVPLTRGPGSVLPGGAVNVGQPVWLRVTRRAADSTLALLVGLIERAGQAKPALALWADRVATWFVAALLLLAVCVLLFWLWVDASRAWPIAIALLVVSCPCALSLATPTALAAATDRLIRASILVVRPHVLETLYRATHIVFDKTGTLTVGKPVVRHIESLAGGMHAALLARAAALEQGSAHPLALAILAKHGEGDLPGAVDLRHVPGQGVEGRIAGLRHRLGSAAYCADLCGSPCPAPAPAEQAAVWLVSEQGWLARFDLADDLRADALAVVRHFQARGKQVILLSGDRNDVTRRIADQLGIERAIGASLPEQKLACVQHLQAGGAVVAMVGDGLNDAAVLSAADVSVAMGGGAPLAQLHADCVLLSGQLASLCLLDITAARTIAVVRQNLWWAALYNLVAIPAAAAGLVNPWLCGVGMSASSAIVVLNALRLRRS